MNKQPPDKAARQYRAAYKSAAILAALVSVACASPAHCHGGWGGGGGGGEKWGGNQFGGQSRQQSQTAAQNAKGPAVKALPLLIHDKWAVLVGVGHYLDPGIKPVKYAARNVLTLTENFCDPQVGRFLPDHVLVATEDKVTQESLADSTWQNWLTKKALPNDMIVLYFCMRFVPADDASDILLLTEESKLASKETSATSLSSVLGEVRRRTQCKNIIALLDINPTEQTAKNYPYGLGSLLRTIGQKAGVTILSADDRLLGSLDDDGQARTSVFVEYFCQALKAGGGALSLDYIASYLGQILSNQAPGGSDRYISHPILLAAADNPELVKMPLGVAVRNPNSLADIKIGRSLSQVAQSDPALAAHLAQLDRSSSSTQKLEKLKQAQDAADEENASEQEREREKGKPWEKEEKEEGQGENPEVDFAPYMTTMKKTIQGKWGPPKGLDQKTVVAVFSIQKDGSIVDSEIVQSSGNATIDQSALKALADASPLAPLPKGAPKRVQIRYKFDWKASQ